MKLGSLDLIICPQYYMHIFNRVFMKQLHHIQLTILKKLLFSSTLRYTDMKPDSKMDNNQFDFHLDSLVHAGMVEKMDNGYALTASGKEYANRMDTDEVKILRQAKLGARVGCIRTINGVQEFLVYTRKKQPFFNCQGFLAGKIRYGEKVLDAAVRELQEETGLSGSPVLVEIEHMRVYAKETKELLEDKFFFFYKVENPTGMLTSNEEGEHNWIPEHKLAEEVTNPFNSLDEFFVEIALLKNFDGTVLFIEKEVYSSKF